MMTADPSNPEYCQVRLNNFAVIVSENATARAGMAERFVYVIDITFFAMI